MQSELAKFMPFCSPHNITRILHFICISFLLFDNCCIFYTQFNGENKVERARIYIEWWLIFKIFSYLLAIEIRYVHSLYDISFQTFVCNLHLLLRRKELERCSAASGTNGTWEVLTSHAYWNNNDMRGSSICDIKMKTRAAHGVREGTNLPNRHVYTLHLVERSKTNKFRIYLYTPEIHRDITIESYINRT